MAKVDRPWSSLQQRRKPARVARIGSIAWSDPALAARLLAMLETANQLRRVGDLMALARADARVQRQPLDLNVLAADVLDEVPVE